MDRNALLKLNREGVDEHPDVDAINVSRQTQDPFNALIRHVWTGRGHPKAATGAFSDPELDKVITSILSESTRRSVWSC